MVRSRRAVLVSTGLLLISIVLNIRFLLFHDRQQQRLDDKQTRLMERVYSNLSSAAGYVNPIDLPVVPAAALPVKSSADILESLGESLKSQGIPHVSQIALTLDSIATVFVRPKHSNLVELKQDAEFLKKVERIMQINSFPNGKLIPNTLGKTFTQLYDAMPGEYKDRFPY